MEQIGNIKVSKRSNEDIEDDGEGALPDPGSLKLVTGSEDPDFATRLISQISGGQFMGDCLDQPELEVRAHAIKAALSGISPKNELEGMLAAQMIATNNAAFECLRRAMARDQIPHGTDQHLKHAEKLMALFTRQLDAFNKLRGKGGQKITVEHVNVEAGGQAVVGNVQVGDKPAALEDRSNESMDLDGPLIQDEAEKVKEPRRKAT